MQPMAIQAMIQPTKLWFVKGHRIIRMGHIATRVRLQLSLTDHDTTAAQRKNMPELGRSQTGTPS